MSVVVYAAIAAGCLGGAWLIGRVEKRRKSPSADTPSENNSEPSTLNPINADVMKISVNELLRVSKEPYVLYLPSYVDVALLKCKMTGDEWGEVPNTYLADVAEAVKRYEREQKRRMERADEERVISEHRLSGMEMEKIGDNAGAISEYAVAIVLGEQSAHDLFSCYAHAYERLFVCLHRAKDFDREAKYIEDYLKHDLSEATRSKYSSRLENLKAKVYHE